MPADTRKTETTATSRRTVLSCTECGDTVATFRPVPIYSSVWCGRQCCFFKMLDWQPDGQWFSYATVSGFRVLRRVFEAEASSASPAVPAAPASTPEKALA